MSSYTSSSRRRVALLAAAIVVGLNQLGRVPVPPKYLNNENRVYATAARRARTEAYRADVIAMGNSRVMFSIDPHELALGLRLPQVRGRNPIVTDLATPATTPASDLWMWRRATSGSRVTRARLVIVGVAPIDFTQASPGNDYGLRYLYRLPDVLWLAREGRVNAAATLLTYQVLPLYGLRASVINAVLRRPSRESLLPASARKDAVWLVAFEGWYKNYRVDPWQVRCLTRMVAEMRARGMIVILVSPPSKTSLLRIEAGQTPGEPLIGRTALAGRPGSPLRLFRSMMRREFGSREGVIFLDYMHAQDSRGLKFWDPAHMLPASAVVFTRRFVADLNRALAQAGPAGRDAVQEQAPPVRH